MKHFEYFSAIKNNIDSILKTALNLNKQNLIH